MAWATCQGYIMASASCHCYIMAWASCQGYIMTWASCQGYIMDWASCHCYIMTWTFLSWLHCEFIVQHTKTKVTNIQHIHHSRRSATYTWIYGICNGMSTTIMVCSKRIGCVAIGKRCNQVHQVHNFKISEVLLLLRKSVCMERKHFLSTSLSLSAANVRRLKCKTITPNFEWHTVKIKTQTANANGILSHGRHMRPTLRHY